MVCNRGPSAYQPNALPLGKTGSQMIHNLKLYIYSQWFISPLVFVIYISILIMFTSVILLFICMYKLT